MANFVEEIQAQKASLMSKGAAAKELASLISNPVVMADFETLRNITLVAVHMQLPSHLPESAAVPSSRRTIIWAKVLLHLKLLEVPAKSMLCEAGGKGDRAHYLLNGSVELGDTVLEEPWTAIGAEALNGQHYWCDGPIQPPLDIVVSLTFGWRQGDGTAIGHVDSC